MMAGSSTDHVQLHESYQNWMNEQQQLLEELLQVYNQNANEEQELCRIIEKLIKHFQDYINKRAQQATEEAPSFFSPSWCSSIENSLLWIGGCRPSALIRHVYSLSASQLESQLSEYFEGVRTGNIGELSADQLNLVSELQCRTINEEEILSKKMAVLQENLADCPLTRLAKTSNDSDAESESRIRQQVEQALDLHSKDLGSVLVDADNLRMNTLKELVGIFTPLQAVEFLIAGKKLHLCLHQWGHERDHRHGRTYGNGP